MPDTYIKNGGNWSKFKKAFIKNGGTWSEIKTIWIKNGGVWSKSFVNETIVNVASQNNINLKTLYTNQTGAAPSSAVRVIYNINGNIGSTSTATAAIVTDTWPAGSEIVVNVDPGVYVVGAGGNGGNGTGGSAPGQAGGNAISLGYSITIVNNGVIGGGGGGGGSLDFRLGGGGAGKNAGAGGRYTYSQGDVQNGNAGTLTAGGTGKGTAPFGGGSPGANGGNLGVSASTLVVTNYPAQFQTTSVAGGAAGKAIALNNYTATRPVVGTVFGDVS